MRNFEKREYTALLYTIARVSQRLTSCVPSHSHVIAVDAELAEISDPTNPRYGQWMTQEQVEALTASDPAVRKEVREYLAKAAGAVCVDFPHSLRCEATAAGVEGMLQTRITTFKQSTKGDRLVHRIHPRETYTYPAELKALFLTNLADFPTVNRRNGRVAAWNDRGQATDYTVILETLKDFYNFGTLAGNAGTTTAPAEFQNDTSYNKADLAAFAKGVGVADWKINKTVGPYDGANPDAEASLDTQYIGAVSHGGTQWYWTEEDWQ